MSTTTISFFNLVGKQHFQFLSFSVFENKSISYLKIRTPKVEKNAFYPEHSLFSVL